MFLSNVCLLTFLFLNYEMHNFLSGPSFIFNALIFLYDILFCFLLILVDFLLSCYFTNFACTFVV